MFLTWKSAAVYDEENGQLTIFAVNRHLSDKLVLECDVRSFSGFEVIEHIVLENDDMRAVNTANSEQVKPHSGGDAVVNDGKLKAHLPKASWNVIRLALKDQ